LPGSATRKERKRVIFLVEIPSSRFDPSMIPKAS